MEILKVTEQCFKWCQEQYSAHERNIQIQDQSFVIIALVMLVIYNVISSNWDKIISNTEIDENKLNKIHEGLYFGVFVMLIAHLVYIIIQ